MIERARRLLALHGLSDAELVLAPDQGEVNHTYLAGAYVVRIARLENDESLDDWRTEVLAHPYAHRNGVRTPRLAAWGEGYTIVERIVGRNMDATAPEAFFRDLGIQLARLHALAFPADPDGVLDDHAGPVSLELAQVPAILRPLAERLAPYAMLTGETFIHGDLLPGNVLVGPNAEAFLIDWGDAGYGHPAYDLCAIPLAGLPATLATYGATTADFRRRLVFLRIEIAACRAGEGEPAWNDELLAHRALVEHLVA